MNEVNETIRVLDHQIGQYKLTKEKYWEAYNEFSKKCENLDNFDFISRLLDNILKYYDNKISESNAAKLEIMKKYQILEE